MPPVLILEPMPSPVLCSVLAGHKRSIELAEIYPKFIKPPIQIAGPKNLQHTMSSVLAGHTHLNLKIVGGRRGIGGWYTLRGAENPHTKKLILKMQPKIVVILVLRITEHLEIVEC